MYISYLKDYEPTILLNNWVSTFFVCFALEPVRQTLNSPLFKTENFIQQLLLKFYSLIESMLRF